MTTINTSQAANNVLSSLARTESTDKKAEETTQSRFLKMLTTQLKNQDPMNPLENAEVTSQLAQMSTVDGIERLNSLFEKFVATQESNESLQAAALVGRGVLVPGSGLMLTEAGGVGGFELTDPVDSVTLTIKDSMGLEVARKEFGEMNAGSHNFLWDGAAIDGSRAANGMYTMSLTALQGGEKMTVDALEFGQVSGVIRGPKSTDLQIGDRGIFKFDDVKQIL